MKEDLLLKLLEGTVNVSEIVAALPTSIREHSQRVAEGTVQLLWYAIEENIYEEGMLHLDWEQIQAAAQYHDLGLALIPDRVLFKPDELTGAERRVIQRHAGYGAKILDLYRSNAQLLPAENDMWQLASEIAIGHHERWDGRGYPFGVMATAIPLVVRATSIVDAYDAIVRGAPYCMPLPHTYALVEILDNAGSQFDPQLAKIFVKRFQELGEMAAQPNAETEAVG